MDLRQYWPQIGSSGSKPNDGQEWVSGDNYFAAHLNYLWNYVRVSFGEVEDQLNAIDSNDDGVVDEADYANDADASTYKGNDIDSDGDGEVDWADTARNSERLGSELPSYYATQASVDDHLGDDTNPHNVTVSQIDAYSTSNTYSMSQADSTFIIAGDVVPHSVYTSTSDVPALNTGDAVYVEGDGLYIEDGT